MPEQTQQPKILPLRSFKLLRSEEYPNFAVLEVTTSEGAVRYAVTREILETLSTNMSTVATKMPVPAAAAAAPAAAPRVSVKPAKK